MWYVREVTRYLFLRVTAVRITNNTFYTILTKSLSREFSSSSGRHASGILKASILREIKFDFFFVTVKIQPIFSDSQLQWRVHFTTLFAMYCLYRTHKGGSSRVFIQKNIELQCYLKYVCSCLWICSTPLPTIMGKFLSLFQTNRLKTNKFFYFLRDFFTCQFCTKQIKTGA